MAELKFNGCRLEVQLEAQSPMIHFQYSQPGATIRATEVKPKLDRMILGRLQNETGKTIGELKKSSEYGGIFVDKEHDALNYRLELDASGQPYKVVTVGNMKTREYDMFYGNNGKHSEAEKLKGVFSNPKLTILCFNKILRGLLERWLEEFFLVTNFGTMQSKGFGGFVPAGVYGAGGQLTPDEEKKIAEALKRKMGADCCYSMRFGDVPKNLQEKNKYCQKIFSEIKTFYSIMKSGQNFRGYSRSYIYKYMHGTDNDGNAGDVSIDNEKAWMKQNGIAPIVAKPGNEKKTDLKDDNPRYVRALLGIGGSVTFVKANKDRSVVSIADKSKDAMERMASPIMFKVVGNVVFIAAREVPDEIYDREFEFYNKDREFMTGGKLRTPSREDFKDGRFDIQKFLACYVGYYNSPKLRKDLYGIKDNVIVEVV